MSYSDVGKTRLKVYAALYAVNIVVLALSARVNQFQEFFYMADLFPLGLSITTLILLSVTLLLDFCLHNPLTSRPPFEIGLLAILTIFWLAFNAFSTSRWRHVPFVCSSIPAQYADEKAWCRDLQALKAFVWVEWVILLLTTLLTTRYAVREHAHGNTHVWGTALARYAPRYSGGGGSESRGGAHRRTSSFFTDFGPVGGAARANANMSMHSSFVDFGREDSLRSWAT